MAGAGRKASRAYPHGACHGTPERVPRAEDSKKARVGGRGGEEMEGFDWGVVLFYVLGMAAGYGIIVAIARLG